jgi:hypothetical protein
MIKSFIELAKAEVPITKKPTFTYNKAQQKLVQSGEVDTLSWVDCLHTLYKNGAEKVIFEHVPNENGGLLFLDENGAASIRVFVDIDGDRREIFYPLIDGTKDVALDKVTQSDIYNAKQRAFVKCVAVNWGLGINLWKKEDDPDKVAKISDDVSISESFRTLVNDCVKKLGSVPEVLSHLNSVSEKKIKELIIAAKEIDAITKTLTKVLHDN